MRRRSIPRDTAGRFAFLFLLALSVVLLSGPPAVGALAKDASSDPPTKPDLHPFRECSQRCDDSYGYLETTTPLLSAVSTDPDSASLTYTFTIEDYMTDRLLASEQFVAPPGDEVRWQVPEGVVTGHTTYRWNVTVQDESSTVSDDKYFAYHKPDGLLTRVRRSPGGTRVRRLARAALRGLRGSGARPRPAPMAVADRTEDAAGWPRGRRHSGVHHLLAPRQIGS